MNNKCIVCEKEVDDAIMIEELGSFVCQPSKSECFSDYLSCPINIESSYEGEQTPLARRIVKAYLDCMNKLMDAKNEG